jgi:hypothetical protein
MSNIMLFCEAEKMKISVADLADGLYRAYSSERCSHCKSSYLSDFEIEVRNGLTFEDSVLRASIDLIEQHPSRATFERIEFDEVDGFKLTFSA